MSITELWDKNNKELEEFFDENKIDEILKLKFLLMVSRHKRLEYHQISEDYGDIVVF